MATILVIFLIINWQIKFRAETVRGVFWPVM